MLNFILDNQTTSRLTIFFGFLITMIVLEFLIPKRSHQMRRQRWAANFSIIIISSITVRIVSSLIGISAAVLATKLNFGLFNHLDISLVWKIVWSIIILDLIIYWQHRLFHNIPILWSIHKMHHSDTVCDVSTATRFHPLEIILSYLIKFSIAFLLGIPMIAIIIFDIILSSAAMFNHSNISIIKPVDKIIRKLIVTPDMHRIHHSIYPSEHNSNYGFNISIWDKLFKSYTSSPKDGQLKMTIGLSRFRDHREQKILELLKQPFKKEL